MLAISGCGRRWRRYAEARPTPNRRLLRDDRLVVDQRSFLGRGDLAL